MEGTYAPDKFSSSYTLESIVDVNGGKGPIEWLTGGRAKAIIDLLIKEGVNTDQLIKGKGKVVNTKIPSVIMKSN